MPSPANIESS